MYSVEMYARVRRACMVEGMSVREAPACAGETSDILSRNSACGAGRYHFRDHYVRGGGQPGSWTVGNVAGGLNGVGGDGHGDGENVW